MVSQHGVRCGGDRQLWLKRVLHSWRAKLVHFSIYYDSLIEKCSTLSAVRALVRSRVPFSSKLSV
jgi:hypothetical protein